MNVNVNGATFYVEQQGSGPNLVLVHGMGYTSTDVWQYVVPKLAEEFTVLTYDLRGHGQSTDPDNDQSISTHADDLVGILDHFEIDQTSVAGFSFGGMVAQQFALRYTDRLEKLLLVTTSACLTDEAKEYYDGRAEKIKTRGVDSHADDAVRIVLSESFREANPDKADEYREAFLQNNPDSYAGAMRAMLDWDGREGLASLENPTLVIGGEEDDTSIMGEGAGEAARELAELLPNGELVMIPETIHYPQIEKPEIVSEKMLEFLKKAY